MAKGRKNTSEQVSPAPEERDAPAEVISGSDDPTQSSELKGSGTPSVPDGKDDLRSTLKAMLSVPRSKGAVPVLATYKQDFFERYFILDVDPDAFRKAWEFYKNKEGADPMGFVQVVITVLELDFPRMYRAVAFVPLK